MVRRDAAAGAGPDAPVAQRDVVRARLRDRHAIAPGQFVAAICSLVIVIACVLVHYEVLRQLSDWLSRMRKLPRTRVLVLILGLLTTHIFEIWIYALGFALKDGVADFGTIAHVQDPPARSEWLDYVYYSFMTFTTVGYGDLIPCGPIRFIAATEALAGFVLLGWSPSFTFLEMQRFWREPKGGQPHERGIGGED